MLYIISLVISVFFSVMLKTMFKKMLIERGCLTTNYLGDEIPVGMGLMFIPVMVSGTIPLLFVTDNTKILLAYIIGAAVMGFSGFIDDMMGDGSVKGLKGHIGKLMNGELTTGGFKALSGLLTALFISSCIRVTNINLSAVFPVLEFLMNVLIITLSTNFLNLLDLRPGRSIKGFLSMIILTFLFARLRSPAMAVVFPLLCAVIVYMGDDLKARSMLGDTGSNILGISAGAFVALFGSWYFKIVCSLFLVAIHIYTERYSLTRLIEENSLLKFLDDLGR